MKSFLENAINNWYKNAEIDYDVTGKFIDAHVIGDNLQIIWEEMGERLDMVISYFKDYSPEQLYNIWMEMA